MTIAFIMMVTVWPAKVIKHKITSAPQETAVLEDREFTSEDKLLQTYTPQCDFIKEMNIAMSITDAATEDQITFVMYDKTYAPVFSQEYDCLEVQTQQEQMESKVLPVEMELTVMPGEVYYYEVLVPEQVKAKITLSLGQVGALGQIEDGMLFDGGKPDSEHALSASYSYIQPLSLTRTIAYYVAIFVIGILLYIGLSNLFIQFPKATVKFTTTLRMIAAIFAAGLLAVALYFAVYLNVFGGALLDQIIFGLGILTVGAIMFLWLFRKKWLKDRRVEVSTISATTASGIWRAYLQTLCIAGVIYQACLYVNATELKMQYEHNRWLLVFLGLAVLTGVTVEWKTTLDKIAIAVQALWIVGASVYALWYIKTPQALENTYLAKLYMMVMVVWGLVIINTLFQIRVAYLKQLWSVYLVVFVLFAVFMYCNRAQRLWPVTVLVPFITILLRQMDSMKLDRIMRNLCNGIIVAFFLMMFKALLYRPYVRWMFYRYPGYFHTVACTGMFLGLVVCAAMVKFYVKARDSKHIFQDTWSELLICGITMVYVYLTMSRTALMAIFATLAVIIVVTAFMYHKKLWTIIKELMLFLGVSILCFPMIYSATRMIPAIVNKPYRFEAVEPSVEEYGVMVAEGDPINSDKYMDMERFLELFGARIPLPEFLVSTGENLTARVENVSQSEQDKKQNDSAENTVNEENADLDEDAVEKINKSEETNHTEEITDSEQNETSEVVEDSDESKDSEDEDQDKVTVMQGTTNGRMTIYKDYLQHMTLTGHESMQLESSITGEKYAHAHDSYLQVAYDFGIPAGLLFLLFCLMSFIRAIQMSLKLNNKMEYVILLVGIIVTFGMESITEWAFHQCIPIGFAFLAATCLLMKVRKQ